jgi:hypothetical protein
MRTKLVLCYFLLIIFFNTLSAQKILPQTHQKIASKDIDSYLQALASLVFHAQEWEDILESEDPDAHEEISFSNEEIYLLWNKLYHYLYRFPNTPEQIQREYLIEKAFQLYEKAKNNACIEIKGEAQEAIHLAVNLLRLLWEEAIELEESSSNQILDFSAILRSKADPNFEDNPYISVDARNRMKPYLLPLRHPMRAILDDLCLKTRITMDEKNFHQAGFQTIVKRPRSYIHVASHPKMKGYLVKAYLDNDLNEKHHKPSWEWLVRRCEGAEKIKNIIKKRRIKHFVVARKWIYCFPPDPSPPHDPRYTRHLALLVVTNMNLTTKKLNLHAWLHYISEEHLDELYAIISRAKGSSYRPDNIAYTRKKKFAFIDTEYPTKGPDYKRIRRYLSPEMRDYWDYLVKNGGSS